METFIYAKQRLKLFHNPALVQSTCGNPLATMSMILLTTSCFDLCSTKYINGVCPIL